MLEALLPYARRGVPVIGLEPSCLFTLRDEFKAMLPGEDTDTLADQALLFEEFLVREAEAGRLVLPLGAVAAKAVVHGHCHQKSFGAFKPVEKVLRLVPGLEVKTIESSCCGMAGAFGYGADTYQASIEMAELADEQWITREDSHPVGEALQRACSAAGFSPAVAFAANDYQEAQAMVAIDLGVSMAPRLALSNLREDVRVIALRGAPSRRILLAHLVEHRLTPAETKLSETFVAVAGDGAA